MLPFSGDLPAIEIDEHDASEPKDDSDWKFVEGPGGGRGVARRLKDGSLVNLGITFRAPDADVYEAARQWMGDEPPSQVWIFPDTSVPKVDTAEAVRSATRQIRRWVRPGNARRSVLEDVGFTREESRALQRDLMSGELTRIDAAAKTVEERISNRDPKEIETTLQAFLRRP